MGVSVSYDTFQFFQKIRKDHNLKKSQLLRRVMECGVLDDPTDSDWRVKKTGGGFV